MQTGNIIISPTSRKLLLQNVSHFHQGVHTVKLKILIKFGQQ